MTSPWVALVAGRSLSIASLDELRAILSRVDGLTIHEFWLSHHDGPRICLLRNGGHALVMIQSFDEDPGVVALAPDSSRVRGPVQFTLQNGQRDEYPAHWIVEADQAFAAIEYFFATTAQTPALEWTRGNAD